MPAHGCHICRILTNATHEEIVHRDEHWTASAAMSVPGWIMLSANRHNQGIWELTEAEARTLGPLLVRLSSAIKQARDAEKVYVLSAGESEPHFHALLMARGAEIPADWRAMAYFGKAEDLHDAEETGRATKAIREALQALPA